MSNYIYLDTSSYAASALQFRVIHNTERQLRALRARLVGNKYPDGARSAQSIFFKETVPVIHIWPTYQKLSQSVKNFLRYGEKRPAWSETNIPMGCEAPSAIFFIESVPVIRIWPTYQKLSQSVKNFLSYGEKRQFRTVFMRFFGFTAENQNSNRAKWFSVT